MSIFDFSNPETELSNLWSFIDHWLGPAPTELSLAIQDHLIEVNAPEPLRSFYANTTSHTDGNGNWIWQRAVPTLLQPSEIHPVQSTEYTSTSDWLIIGHYLGQSEVRVPATLSDCPVVEIDGEESIYHDSLSNYLVRFSLRHLATFQPRWKPVADYESLAQRIIDTADPTCDVSWRLPDPRDPSLLHTPPINPDQQTTAEHVWLIENDDVMVYRHGDSDQLTLSARTDAVLDRLLSQHGLAAPTLIDVKLPPHPDLQPRQQWRLRVTGDGSATMSLQIPGIPSAEVRPGTLDIRDLARQIDAEVDLTVERLHENGPQVTIVRGPNDNGTRVQAPNSAIARLLSAFVDQVQAPSREFEHAWQRYRPDYF